MSAGPATGPAPHRQLHDPDSRPLAGRQNYDLSFVDMENEWESVREFSVAYGTRSWFARS